MKKLPLTLALAAFVGLAGLAVEKAEAKNRGRATVQYSNGQLRIGGRINIGFPRSRRVQRHRHTSCCQVVRHPGYWSVERVPIWRAGYYKTVTVPARYETRYDDCGNPYQVLVEPACTRRVFVKPHVEYVDKRVWVKGYSEYLCGY